MKIANQLTFTTYEASLKLNPNDPVKIIFDNIDWSFIRPLVRERYKVLPQGADGYDPISLLKAQLLIYLGEVTLKQVQGCLCPSLQRQALSPLRLQFSQDSLQRHFY